MGALPGPVGPRFDLHRAASAQQRAVAHASVTGGTGAARAGGWKSQWCGEVPTTVLLHPDLEE